ncbi:hypothetical protein [Spirochaeta lutea]|uniref:hypothetical protein n=1 Tax=Spirochaeta lutea TaxID=1480694 RepID=UPI00068DD5D8|nr:hypothetical protein [Spirochaeta lutea]
MHWKNTIRFWFLLLIIPLVFPETGLASTIRYKEQFWRMYHQQLYMYPLDIAENIHWLETALRMDFANPLWAIARIENEREWEKYRNLFLSHISVKLVELYLQWGNEHYKHRAYFYNAPWKQENLESLSKAESLFEFALVYWEDAKEYAEAAQQFSWINLEEIQNWEDEAYRIQTGQLDYEAIINRHLTRLNETRRTFEEMDSSTY